MSQISKLLDKEVVLAAERGLELLGKNGALAKKLQAIIAAKEHGITLVAEVFGVTRATLTAWIKSLKYGTLEDLLPKPKTPRKSLLSPAQKQIIKQWIATNPKLTIAALRLKIAEDLQVNVSQATAHRLLKNLGFSYITPRPRHYKQDPTLQEEFKKKSTRARKGSP